MCPSNNQRMTFSSTLGRRRKSSDVQHAGSENSAPTSTANASPAVGYSTDEQFSNIQMRDCIADDPWAPENLTPLGVLALELGCTVDELAKRLGDDCLLDDIGLRVCSRAVAAALIADRDARKAERRRRDAEAQKRITANSTTADTRHRVKALAEREPSGNSHADLHLSEE